jgi:hypothetical protein
MGKLLEKSVGPTAHSANEETPPSLEQPSPPGPDWTSLMSSEEWDVYYAAIQALRAAGIRFVLGGAFGLASHTGRWRNTKDIDFFILPAQREAAVQALLSIGCTDYHGTLAYDRGWIFRAIRNGILVDLIWGTPNRRTEVDEQWFAKAPSVQLRTERLEVIPAEELLWIKLYVLQRDRCDWPDVINLLYATGRSLDWERLVARLGDDKPLLMGLLSVYSWLCPDRIDDIPANLRKAAAIAKPTKAQAQLQQQRLDLLDTRPWFAALQPTDRPMQL